MHTSDLDHASGLSIVLSEMRFGTLIMHEPWKHAADIREALRPGRLTAAGLEEKLRKELEAAHALEEIALEKGRPIVEPFEGVSTQDRSIMVLGPSKDYYQSLLCAFRLRLH